MIDNCLFVLKKHLIIFLEKKLTFENLKHYWQEKDIYWISFFPLWNIISTFDDKSINISGDQLYMD